MADHRKEAAANVRLPDPENDYLDANRRRTADGTVPFAGACPPFPDRAELLCVSPDDCGPFEIGDKTLATLSTFHSFVPAMNLVQRLTIKFLRPGFCGNCWGYPAPGVDKPRWPVKAEVRRNRTTGNAAKTTKPDPEE